MNYIAHSVHSRNRRRIKRLIENGSSVFVLFAPSWDPAACAPAQPLPGSEDIALGLTRASDLAFKHVSSLVQSHPFLRKQVNILTSLIEEKSAELVLKASLMPKLIEYFKIHELLQSAASQKLNAKLLDDPKLEDYLYCKYLLEGGPAPSFFNIQAFSGLFLTWARMTLKYMLLLPRPSVSEKLEFACTINSEGRQFAASHKVFDILFENSRIKPKQIMFFPQINLSSGAETAILKKGYRLKPRLLHLSLRTLPVYFRAGWAIWTRSFWMRTKDLLLFSQFAADALHWKTLLIYNPIQNFVSLSDYSLRSRFRNAVLREENVITWYFLDSGALYNLCTYKPEEGNSLVHHYMTFMNYDHFVSWNSALANHFEDLGGRFEKLHVTGCVWSRPFTPKTRVDNIRGIRIGVFDSSFHKSLPTNRAFGKRFYVDMLRLLEENGDIHITFKPKFPLSDFNDDPDFQAIYRKFENHPRVRAETTSGSSMKLIEESDFVLTCFPSSVSLEAIGGGRTAILYEPGERYRGTFMDDIPGYFLHGYNELNAFIERARHQDFRELVPLSHPKYLEKVDPFQDGKGLDRFRALLFSENAKQ